MIEVELPDGSVLEVQTDDPSAAATAGRRFLLKQQNPGEYDSSSPQYRAKYGAQSDSTLENFRAGIGKTMTDVAQGIGQTVGLVGREDVAQTRKNDADLSNTKAGLAGQIVGGVASAAPVAMIPGVNTVAGAGLAGATMGALAPSTSAQETLANTAIGGAMGAAGQYVGDKVANFAGRKLAEWTAKRQAAAAANSVRDATLAAGKAEGFVVPPATTNPTATTRALESVAGKAATQQSASLKNQAITNAIARRELGLAKDSPITPQVLESIRSQAGKAYEAVKQVGTITADDTYLNQVAMLSRQADGILKSFPKAKIGGAQEIRDLQDAMYEASFDADAAMEFLKSLRKEASDNLKFTVDDPARKALGRAQSQAAGFLESLVERNLKNAGKGDLIKDFREARTLIAKSYTVEKALNEGSGNVSGAKLAAALRKDAKLSGGLETAAKFAQSFPKAMAEPTSSPGVSALDAMVGGVGGLTVNPSLAALPFGRIGVRELLLSRPGQALATPSYDPGTASLLMRLLQASPPLTNAAAIGVPAYVGK